jgi:molybdopterin synthase catalytic subunit
MIRIQTGPLAPGALLEGFCRERETTGAVASFTGLTRGGALDDTDRGPVGRLVLDAYPGFTETVMQGIEAETRARFAIQDVLAVHRWGPIAVGEPIVFVAVAAAHRRAALEAVDFLMDQFKTRAPFWKKEEGPGGSRWIEPSDQDHADLARWETS